MDQLYSQLPSWKALLAGASAGLIQDAILHPIDTLRARLQVNSTKVNAGLSPMRALVSVASTTLRKEGLRGLYGGVSWATWEPGNVSPPMPPPPPLPPLCPPPLTTTMPPPPLTNTMSTSVRHGMTI